MKQNFFAADRRGCTRILSGFPHRVRVFLGSAAAAEDIKAVLVVVIELQSAV